MCVHVCVCAFHFIYVHVRKHTPSRWPRAVYMSVCVCVCVYFISFMCMCAYTHTHHPDGHVLYSKLASHQYPKEAEVTASLRQFLLDRAKSTPTGQKGSGVCVCVCVCVCVYDVDLCERKHLSVFVDT
jgi:hypothetical protein